MLLSKDPIVIGRFIERPNRFIAWVELEDKSSVKVHVPNTGRMQELLISGAIVKCAFQPSARRKTAYTLLAVRYHETWVCIYAAMANDLAESYMRMLPEVSALKREVTWGNSRFDLGCKIHGEPALYEVKSVNLVIDRFAMFPDAPTVRGSKHLKELMIAQEKGFRTGVLFVIMRADADFFVPHIERDPVFAKNLFCCIERKMTVKALKCAISEEEIQIDTTIPVLRHKPEINQRR